MMLLLAILAAIATGALIVLTTILHRTTENAAAATENVRLAAEAQVDLLLHQRASDPLVRRDIEGSLLRRLAAARAFVTTDSELAVLDRSETSVAAYVDASTRSPDSDLEASRHYAAYAALDELVNINVEQAKAARREASRLDDFANVVGLSVSALLVVVAAGLALWLRGRAFEPIFALAGVMQRFGAGERDVRAAERGPAELRDMSRRFNEMASALAERRQAQIAFLGGVAHDLRNPLSVLQLGVAMIDPSGPLPPEDRLRKIIERVRSQITRMERMVGDFLDMAKIEAGELDLRLEVHDARALVHEVATLFDPEVVLSRLHIDVPDQPVWTRCDPLRIEQVLTNLVSNAIKYSPAGTRIDVRVREDAEQVVLRVRDRGFGIAEHEREHVFEPFRRGGRSKDSVPGAGLGLFVVRKIVEAHGGRISVDSELGSGSTFTVSLLLGSPPSGASVRSAAS